MQRKASIDGLTRIWNRDAITALTKLEFSRALRGSPVSLAVIDVDHFKTVNDSHGHQTGDQALKAVAQSIRSGVRDFDSVGRYGGDEFVAVLSNCDAKSAVEVCERIRSNVEQATIPTPGGALSITVTIGVATHRESFKGVDDLVAAADAALYRAKNAGRNRIEGDAT